MFALVVSGHQSSADYATFASAKAAAKFYSRKFGKSVAVLNVERDLELKLAAQRKHDAEQDEKFCESDPRIAGTCEATTKKGSPCKRTAHFGGFCKQHGGLVEFWVES